MSESTNTFQTLLTLLVDFVCLKVGEDAYNDGGEGCDFVAEEWLLGHLQFTLLKNVECIDCYYRHPERREWRWCDSDYFRVKNLYTGVVIHDNRDQLIAALTVVDANLHHARVRGTERQEFPEYAEAMDKWLDEAQRQRQLDKEAGF